MSIGQPSNGVIELARHTKSPWCDCPCGIPFSHDNRPVNAVLRKTLVLHSGGFLGETIASILILFSFVRQGQISNRLNSQKITLRVITLLSTFLRSYCRNRTWKCVVPRCYEART